MKINNVARRLYAEWGTKEMPEFLRVFTPTPAKSLTPVNYACTEGAIIAEAGFSAHLISRK